MGLASTDGLGRTLAALRVGIFLAPRLLAAVNSDLASPGTCGFSDHACVRAWPHSLSALGIAHAQSRIAALADELDWYSAFVLFVPLAFVLKMLIALQAPGIRTRVLLRWLA